MQKKKKIKQKLKKKVKKAEKAVNKIWIIIPFKLGKTSVKNIKLIILNS